MVELYPVGFATDPQVEASSVPQLAVGILIPAPRKVMPASSMIAVPIAIDPHTRSVGRTCGIRCLRMIQASLAPLAVAASTNSCCRSDSSSERTIRAG